jgi:phenylpropionate dioxygenase-like ring-hydroxylating dioxygenase large terminal subunit
MTVTTRATVESHADVARRLLANVDAGTSDQSPVQMKVPASAYRDPARWDAEMEQVFRRSPLIVALSCDLREPGAYDTLEIAERPVVVTRGDDGVARAFLNVCRHRGALVAEGCGTTRRFTCPYHAWVYDTRGKLVGVPGRDTFGDIDVSGLVELTTHERAGVILAVLTPGLEFDPAEWLAGMDDALQMLRLDELHRYPVLTELDSPNWKLTADGYVDGYHIGYLHSSTIGEKAITNRNTYDLLGPHVRIGFANKPITQIRDRPESEWPPMWEVMSMVHYVFPNVSISGQPERPLMLSRLLPGPTPNRSTTVQYHYYRTPVEGDEAIATAEARRKLYAEVTGQEDFVTGFRINRNLGALGDDHIRFGHNERGNQNLHSWIDALVAGKTP